MTTQTFGTIWINKVEYEFVRAMPMNGTRRWKETGVQRVLTIRRDGHTYIVDHFGRCDFGETIRIS